MIIWMVLLPLLIGCGEATVADGDIANGVWRGEGGPESFYWELWPTAEGYGGVVHTVREGRKETELPVSRVVWQPPHLTLEMAQTGATYRGEVEFAKGRIRGGLGFGGEKGPEMELTWSDPNLVEGLYPRPLPEFGQPIYTYTPPTADADGWETASCGSEGIPPAAVEDLVGGIIAGEGGVIHSLLLVRGGKLVVEEYFHGYGPGDLHRLASVTKSVSSLLIGLAIDRGDIAGIDTPLRKFFPDLPYPEDPTWQSETLRHVLTMSMGLDWDEQGGPHGTGPEHFTQVFSRHVIHAPGTHWDYHSANVNLLAGVIKSATGLHADLFAAQRLFSPLGIDHYDWEFRASDGYRLMDGSLKLRPRDMAKLGMLIRDGGVWQGEQVVSAEWIRESVREQIHTGDGPESYGYLWWVGELPGPTRVVFANGHGSQFISWFPDQDLIAVVTGGNEDNGMHFAVGGLLGRHILPHLRQGE